MLVFLRLLFVCPLVCLLMLPLLASAVDASKPAEPPISVHINQTFQIPVSENCLTMPRDQYASIELRINGSLSQLKPSDCNPDTTPNTFIFKMSQLDNSAAQREALMSSPWRELKSNFNRDLPYSLRYNNAGNDVLLATGTLRYQILQPAFILIGFAFIIVVAFFLVKLGRDSGMLRDTGTMPVMLRSYSLARVQMAWWFFIVFSSYVWLWIVGEGIPEISSQALGLMGIGSAVYMAAASVDASKQNDFGPSVKFFHDIISDGQGLVLYRFQMLVFNVLFGVLFLIYVVQHVSMPDFDGSVLSLLGMSSLTYTGFKIPEVPPKDTTNTTDTSVVITDGNKTATAPVATADGGKTT